MSRLHVYSNLARSRGDFVGVNWLHYVLMCGRACDDSWSIVNEVSSMSQILEADGFLLLFPEECVWAQASLICVIFGSKSMHVIKV